MSINHVNQNKQSIHKNVRSFFNFNSKEIDNALSQTYDFIADGVHSVTETVKEKQTPLVDKLGSATTPSSKNMDTIASNASSEIE